MKQRAASVGISAVVLLLLLGPVAFLPDAPMAPLAANGSGTNAPWAYQMQNMQNTGYSPQTLVNPSNVGSLQLHWTMSASGLAGTPVVSNGVVYIFGAGKCPCLFAVQESTGLVLWADGKGGTQLTGTYFKTRVGVTIDKGLVFAGDQNNNVLAINAVTGALVWNSSLIQGITGDVIPYSGAEATPLAWNGRIIVGVVFGDNGVRGFQRAFNETDGALLWTFYTTPPEPITATNQAGYLLRGSNTWGTDGNNNCTCGGGSVWNVPAVDPSTGTIYFGTGNPWPNDNKTERAPNSSYPNLYTDSVIALDGATGQMKWYFQEVPGYYNGDLDLGMPVQVFNTTINGVQTKVVGDGGKAGYYYELNALTGGEIFKVPLGIHINENETAAGVSWRAQVNTFSSYNPLTNMVYAQADNHGSNCTSKSGIVTCKEFTTPDTANSTLYAIDASTGKKVWTFNTSGYGGGVSSTNSLVFNSDSNHHFYAFNGFTGGVPLWNYTDTSGGTKNFWSWGPPSITDGMVFETTFGNTTAGELEAYIPSASQTSKVQVSIENYAYSPNPVVVVIGVNNTLTWVNYDSVAHTVTASDSSFDSGPIEPSNWFSHTFTSVGTSNYSSTLQPNMKGTVIVKAPVTTTSSTTTSSSSTSSSTPTGFVFTVRVTQKGVSYANASVYVTEGSLTVASGLTNSSGTFQTTLPQGTYSVIACETSTCATSLSGSFPPNAQGGSISLDFSTPTSTTTSSSTTSVSQTSSVTSGSSVTSPTSTTTSSTGGTQPSGNNLFLYASIGVVVLGAAVAVVALWLKRRS